MAATICLETEDLCYINIFNLYVQYQITTINILTCILFTNKIVQTISAVLHYTTLRYTALLYTTLHYSTLHCTVLYYILLSSTLLHSIQLYPTHPALPYPALIYLWTCPVCVVHGPCRCG